LRRRPFVVEAGDLLCEPLPAIRPVVGGSAGFGQRLDMRARFGLCLGDVPEDAESGIGEPNTAIGAENGDAFGEMIDGFALNLDQRVVARFEIDLFGQVLEYPGGAALRMRRCENPQDLAVRQMPEIGLRIERAIDRKDAVLPCLPVQLFR